MALWHISIAAQDRLPLFPEERLRRKALHVLARIAAKALVLFCIVDEHLHLVSVGDEVHKRQLRRSLMLALAPIATAPLDASWVGPVKDRKHLISLVRYHVVQVVKHNLQGVHPALWSGSCFQELVGARQIGALELQTGEQLPRQQIKALACQEVGLPGFDARPISVAALRELGIMRIKAAAASAVAADPDLVGRSKAEILARHVTAQLGRLADISGREIAWALDVTRQGLFEMLKKKIPVGLLNAAGTRLAIEVEVDRRARLTAGRA